MADHEKKSLLPIGADSAAAWAKVMATAPEQESAMVESELALLRSVPKRKQSAGCKRQKAKEPRAVSGEQGAVEGPKALTLFREHFRLSPDFGEPCPGSFAYCSVDSFRE